MASDAEQPLLSVRDGEDKEAAPFQPSKQKGTPRPLRWLLYGFYVAVFVAGIASQAHYQKHHPKVQTCDTGQSIPGTAPRKNIWKNLDLDEAVELRQWLMSPERGLNLTRVDEAYDSDNFIHFVEAAKPPKGLALAHLDAEPGIDVPRYAHAVINHGPAEVIQDYLIGPLPPSPETRMTNITYHNGVIPLNARNTFNWTLLAEYAGRLLYPLEPVFADLFDATLSNGTLIPAGTGPMSYDGAWRRIWVQMRHNVPGSWLHGLDFYVYVDMTGTDPDLYHIIKLMHNQHIYHSVHDLLLAWKQGKLKRSKQDLSPWASRQVRGKGRDLDDRAGPRSVHFDGPRFRADEKEDWVSWMGWTFYLSFERDMGLHFWDIRFKDERIIYELSPQEAMAQYSGSDPHQASSAWLDRSFGMGAMVREVILGYDCPEYAMMLNATVHDSGTSTRHNAICIFERESGRPLSRHYGEMPDESGAVKGYELVVRTVSTVGNYDYIFDYTFMLDGTIEIRLSASGYLQGGAWHDTQDPYGHRIQMGKMGSLHDHVINCESLGWYLGPADPADKVDFDIAGAKNSFMQITLETEEVDQRWIDEDWGDMSAKQQRISREILPLESLLEWPKNAEGAYVVVNQDAKNGWGNPRGYTIHPGTLCHLTNLESKRTERNVNWAKHHLAVSRRKDEETSSSSPWNGNLPGAPPVDFYNFFDDESIEQEDLVVWLNLGTHHIPRAEDSPNTLTNLASSFALLAPWNFNDYDPSIESRNSLIMNFEGNWIVQEPVQPGYCIPPQPAPVIYDGMLGWREDGSPAVSEAGNWLLGVVPAPLTGWM